MWNWSLLLPNPVIVGVFPRERHVRHCTNVWRACARRRQSIRNIYLVPIRSMCLSNLSAGCSCTRCWIHFTYSRCTRAWCGLRSGIGSILAPFSSSRLCQFASPSTRLARYAPIAWLVCLFENIQHINFMCIWSGLKFVVLLVVAKPCFTGPSEDVFGCESL